MEAIDIIKNLIKRRFYTGRSNGYTYCFYCDADNTYGDEWHKKDCSYVVAKEFIKNQ